MQGLDDWFKSIQENYLNTPVEEESTCTPDDHCCGCDYCDVMEETEEDRSILAESIEEVEHNIKTVKLNSFKFSEEDDDRLRKARKSIQYAGQLVAEMRFFNGN